MSATTLLKDTPMTHATSFFAPYSLDTQVDSHAPARPALRQEQRANVWQRFLDALDRLGLSEASPATQAYALAYRTQSIPCER